MPWEIPVSLSNSKIVYDALKAFGEHDPWQTGGGNVTEHVLRALHIPYLALHKPEDVAAKLREAQTLAESGLQPVPLLLTRELMWEDA